MQIPVMLEPLPEGGFQARAGEPLGLIAQGETADLALSHLRDLIQTRTAAGAVLTSIEIPTTKASSFLGGGVYKDDPLFDRWREAIEEYRQQVEDDPNR